MYRILAIATVCFVFAGLVLLASSRTATSAPISTPPGRAMLEQDFDGAIRTDEMRS